MALNGIQARRDRCQLAYDRAQTGKSSGWCGIGGASLDNLGTQLQALQGQEAAMQAKVEALRQETLASPCCPTFLALFHSPRAAAMACELNINPLHWRAFQLLPGPDPENVNWATLQRTWWERTIRTGVVIVPILGE